jgi:hypothetical protein
LCDLSNNFCLCHIISVFILINNQFFLVFFYERNRLQNYQKKLDYKSFFSPFSSKFQFFI